MPIDMHTTIRRKTHFKTILENTFTKQFFPKKCLRIPKEKME